MSDVKNIQPITKNGIRILRPIEVRLLINAIPKLEHKDRFEALLYTGARFQEMRWLYEHQDAFKGEYILMPSMKAKARHKERYIRLNNPGQRAVANFLRAKRNLPVWVGWDENLIRWAKNAGIDAKGISAKTTRRTWEAFLCTSYQSNFPHIFLSQGHTEAVSIEYYLMLPFTTQEKTEIGYYTMGWI